MYELAICDTFRVLEIYQFLENAKSILDKKHFKAVMNVHDTILFYLFVTFDEILKTFSCMFDRTAHLPFAS